MKKLLYILTAGVLTMLVACWFFTSSKSTSNELKPNQAKVGVNFETPVTLWNKALEIKLTKIDEFNNVTAKFRAINRAEEGIGDAPAGTELIYAGFLIRVEKVNPDIPMVMFFVERLE